MHDQTHDGRAFCMLTLIDEYTRECLAIDVSRRMTSESVLERLSDMFVRRGVPDYIRSDKMGRSLQLSESVSGWDGLA